MMRVLVAGGLVVAMATITTDTGGTAIAQYPVVGLERLERWLDAIRQHQPGTVDAPLETIAAWSMTDIQGLWFDIERLISQMRGHNRFAFGVRGRRGGPGEVSNSGPHPAHLACAAAGRIREPECLEGLPPAAVASASLLKLSDAVAAARRRGDGDNYILRRGALLHADIAMLAPPVMESVGSVVLPRQRYRVDIVDGQQWDFGRVPVHWQLARMLLDQVQPANAKRPAPGEDLMVRLWYRATAAWMQWHGDLETDHLERAREIFPTDPDVLFLSGCIHETYAGSRIQNAIHALTLPAGLSTSVGSPRDELRKAERFLRRALEARPGFAEAHLHLGRVLALLGRPSEAVPHLRTANGATNDPLLLYYGHLFLGGASEALRQDSESRTAYEQASNLFPKAQAPHVGLSQLARRRGEREAALDAMQTVFKIGQGADTKDDPWWQYYTSQGRNANDLLIELQRPFRQDDSQ